MPQRKRTPGDRPKSRVGACRRVCRWGELLLPFVADCDDLVTQHAGGATVPARTRIPTPIGTQLGVYEVVSLPEAKQVPGRSGQSSKRNRYFVRLRCVGCDEPVDVREDDLERRTATPCGFCYLSPNPDPEERIKVKRVWNGQEQEYERYRYHGESRSKLHSVWTNMRERCSNPQSEKWQNYGGRGITVDPSWDDSYLTFAAWARANGYAEGLSIDRIDNDAGYGPDNCRWITDLENLLNRTRYLATPLAEALEERADADGVDTYTIIHQAVRAYMIHLESGA